MNKNRALILAVTACFVLAACAEKAEAPKKAAAPAASTPKPPEAPAAAPASSGQDAKPADAPVKLADASAAGKGGGRKKCKKNDAKCDVLVKVDNCVITLNFPDLEVANDRKDDKIEWKIDSPGYAWKGRGVTWKDAGQTQFVDHKIQGAVASWKDKNTDTKTYKYIVEVETEKDKKPCPALDPTIINGVNP